MLSSNGIKKIIAQHGYLYISRKSTLSDFYKISSSLGEIINNSDVRIRPESTLLYQQPDPIDFHTDGPDADIVGWFCIIQDEEAGHSNLIDSRQILDYFSESELALLSGITISYPTGSTTNKEVPLLRKATNGHHSICYLHWSASIHIENTPQELIYNAFISKIKEFTTSRLISLKLHSGEMLFIDNKRMLHSRIDLKKNSPRFLKRAWINCANLKQNTPT